MSLNSLTIAEARDRLRRGEITAVDLTMSCMTAMDAATRNAVTNFVRNLAGQVSMRSMMTQAPVELKIT